MREVNNIFTFKLKCLYTFENFLWKLTSKCQSHDYICVKRTCPVLPHIYIICGFLFCCYCCFYCMIVTLTAPLCSSLHIPLTTKRSLLWSWKERLISLFFCQERNPERCKRSPNSKTCKTTYFGCIAVKEKWESRSICIQFPLLCIPNELQMQKSYVGMKLTASEQSFAKLSKENSPNSENLYPSLTASVFKMAVSKHLRLIQKSSSKPSCYWRVNSESKQSLLVLDCNTRLDLRQVQLSCWPWFIL